MPALADGNTGGFSGDHPAPDDGVLSIEFGQGMKGLYYITFGAIAAFSARRRFTVPNNLDIGAMAGQKRLSNLVVAEVIRISIAFEIGR